MLAIIPARSGSKRIKRKNVKLFRGKPIIAWIIKELKKNPLIKNIAVSSDDKKILKISEKFGSNISILRKKKISDNRTPFQEVIKDVINKLNLKKNEDIIVLFPCSVFLKNYLINKAYKIFKKNKNKFIIGLGKYDHPIQRAYKIKNNKLFFFNSKYELKRTQDLEPSFYDAGQFYIGKCDIWRKKKVHSNSLGIILPKHSSIDIDTIEDWNFAEKISKLFI